MDSWKLFKKIFVIVFVIVFVAVTLVIGSNIFNSVYSGITEGVMPSTDFSNITQPVSEVLGQEAQGSQTVNEVSNVERHGRITSDEIWSGTIYVTGDIFVSSGATLSIEPGTTVLVSANTDVENLIMIPFMLKKGIYSGEEFRDQFIHQGEPYRDEENHIYFFVEGTLNAIGTEEEKIVIKSAAEDPTRYDWTGIHLDSGEISFAEIRDYRVLDLKTGTKLSNSELHNVGECPICIHNSSDILIEDNWVHDSGHEIMDIWNSSPTITNNRFGPSPQFQNPGGFNSGWGGIIVGSGFPTIKDNVIEGFNDAISFFDEQSYEMLGDKVLTENTFQNNVENVVFNASPD